MFYTIYKITNKINGKVYIGSHKTRNLDDNYMGSGKYLLHAIKKHGIENFEKEMLFVFDNPEDMYAKEAELVNDEFLSEANTYNLKIGGFGGFDYINSTGKNKHFGKDNGTNKNPDILAKMNQAQEIKRKEFPEWWNNRNTKIQQKLQEYFATNPGTFTGKNHKLETKKKIGAANTVHQSGTGNSQYGKMWIYNRQTKESKTIKKDEPIPTGWKKGRVVDWDKHEKEDMLDPCPCCLKLKNTKKKYCSTQCALKIRYETNIPKFETHLEDMIQDYINGTSISRCLFNKGMDGTGGNFNKLKKELLKRHLIRKT